MIYCVEDDSSIRELMIYTLQASGFEACGFQDAAAFWDMMKEKKPETEDFVGKIDDEQDHGTYNRTWSNCCDTEFIGNHSNGRWFCQFRTYDIAPGDQCYYGG